MGWKPTTGKPDDAPATPATPGRRRRGNSALSPETAPANEQDNAYARKRRAVRKGRDIDTPAVDVVRRQSPREVIESFRTDPGNGDGEKDDRVRASVRLGKRWSEILRCIKNGDYTWQQFVDGLDEEELARGQLRDSKGGFRGSPPVLVPREFHLACQREQMRRFEQIFGSEVLAISREYVRMAQSPTLKEETRAKMMQYAIERIFGGIPKDVRVSQAQPWEQMVVNVISDDSNTGLPEHLARRYAGYAERQGESSEHSE